MVLYNVTVNIDFEVEADWLAWMKETQIPEVLKTGLFLENKIFRLLNERSNGGTTYAVQFYAKSLNEIEAYMAHYAAAFQTALFERYKDKHVAFTTVLESV